ncbi:MAG: hypothetical protein ACUVXI_10310 [bacterium]
MPKKIGEILVEKGLITRKQLEEALRPRKLGEILVEKGFITEEQIIEALMEQEKQNKPMMVVDESPAPAKPIHIIKGSFSTSKSRIEGLFIIIADVEREIARRIGAVASYQIALSNLKLDTDWAEFEVKLYNRLIRGNNIQNVSRDVQQGLVRIFEREEGRTIFEALKRNDMKELRETFARNISNIIARRDNVSVYLHVERLDMREFEE